MHWQARRQKQSDERRVKHEVDVYSPHNVQLAGSRLGSRNGCIAGRRVEVTEWVISADLKRKISQFAL
jgi:hypothetical protein